MKILKTRPLLFTVVWVVVLLAGCGDNDKLSGKVKSTSSDSDPTTPIAQTEISVDTGDAQQLIDVAADLSIIVKEPAFADSARVVDSWPQARFSTAGLIDSYQQRKGNPEAGRIALLEESYVNCGIPERVYRQLQANTTVTQVNGRTSDADGLPFSMNTFMNKDGVRIVSSNCLTCHGTELFGELVIGLGNEFLDFTDDASVLVERAGALVQGDAETRAWELYADRISAIAPYMRPHTVGVNPANNLTFALIAHRRAEDNGWSNTPLLPLPPTDVPPVSVPPWWRMAKKPAMFNLGEGRLDHARIMMAASMLCTDTPEELAEVDAYAPDIRTYISSLLPPAYPFDVELELADQGRAVFVDNCSHCHGVYEGSGSYPARLVPIATVGTDPTLVEFAHGPGVPYIDWFNRSYYGELSTAAPGPGYVAPPLDGIWATAPFLHNGSVPTIAMVLDSQSRPTYWRHKATDASDPDNYDQNRLGWMHMAIDQGKTGNNDRRIYDTTQPGYSNSGHRFGDHLSAQQRRAVIEYLKTL